MVKAEWYADWFDSPYYHLLYSNRDEKEANYFIDRLCAALELKQGDTIWDLACGKGRHSLALHRKGFDVTGTDLSANSIEQASKHEEEGLRFLVHDMRKPFKSGHFNAVFNLFTSIGYFNDFNDNYTVFKNVAQSLKGDGVFVVDFFNAEKVKRMMIPEQVVQRKDTEFLITKQLIGRNIEKKIEFEDKGRKFSYIESVSLLKPEDFESFGKEAGLKLEHTYGNYSLEKFSAVGSDRLIMFFNK